MVRCVAAAEGWPEDFPPGLLLTELPPSEPLPKIFLNILRSWLAGCRQKDHLQLGELFLVCLARIAGFE